MPEISTIITSYNHAEYVGIAIDSALSQTFKDIEVIVVDDGSTDNSQDIISKIKDPRLTFIPLKENRREHPRNLALSLAKGKYVAFLNSDDAWEPSKLEKQLSYMENNSNVAGCFTRVKNINAKGNEMFSLHSNENCRSRFEWLKRLFLKGNCFCLSSAVVRNSALSKTGVFCPSLFLLSDFDLWLRLAGIADLHIIEESLTKRRKLGGKNLSTILRSMKMLKNFEHARALSRYADVPISNDAHLIFSDKIKTDGSLASIYLGLVKLAWETGSMAHKIFADQLLARILEDKDLRKHAVEIHGAKLIKQFIKNRNEIKP